MHGTVEGCRQARITLEGAKNFNRHYEKEPSLRWYNSAEAQSIFYQAPIRYRALTLTVDTVAALSTRVEMSRDLLVRDLLFLEQVTCLLYQNIKDELPEQDESENSTEGRYEGFYLNTQGAEIDFVEYEQDDDCGACENELGDHERPGTMA